MTVGTGTRPPGLLRLWRWPAALLTVAALSLPLVGRAATFPELYSVTVPADPEARNVRAAAIERAMVVLLTRVTGRRQAGAYPELGGLVDGADRQLTSYAVLDGDDGEEIRVGFNANGVNSYLTSLNWPIWGAERPLLALWVAVDLGGGQRALLSAEDEEEFEGEETESQALVRSIREEVLRAADERGLPVVLPELDALDFQSVSFAEVWGGFDELIERASTRYSADAVLVGRVAITELGLSVRWTLIQGGISRRLQSSVLREGIDWAADLYADEFSVIGGARATRITVVDVDDFDTYARVVSYLETLSVLQTIDVEEFSDDTLILRVGLRGDDRVLERLLVLGGVLEDAAAPTSTGLDFGSTLVFRAIDGAESRQ